LAFVSFFSFFQSNTNQDTNTTKDVIALKDVKTSPEDAVKKAEETYKVLLTLHQIFVASLYKPIHH
jgi:uncharacterized membrane protein YkoI